MMSARGRLGRRAESRFSPTELVSWANGSTQTSPFGYAGILRVVRRVLTGMLASVAFLAGQNFNVGDVKVVGDLQYGQTSAPVDCSGVPSYCAFVFNGQGDDRIDVDVSSAEGKAFVAIADGALAELAKGMNRVVFSLPRRGPDAETYYIVFRDSDGKPRRFTVTLKKLEK
jgi:hypothetical protein